MPLNTAWAALAVRSLLLAYSAGVAVLLLYPFRVERPVFLGNGAVWREGGAAFPAPGLIRSAEPAEALVTRLAVAGSFGIELVVTSYSDEQIGDPSRIVTLSGGPGARNLTIGQHMKDLVVRIRTARNVYSDLVANARRFPKVDVLADHKDRDRKELGRDPRKGEPFIMLREFLSAGERTHVVVSYDGRTLRIFGDGKVYFLATVEDDNFPGSWDTGYHMALGNEVDGSRPWLGAIDVLRVFDRTPAPQHLPSPYGAGDRARVADPPVAAAARLGSVGGDPGLWAGDAGAERAVLRFIAPGNFLYLAKPLLGLPRSRLLTLEAAANVLLFLPFGAFVALWQGRQGAVGFHGLVRAAGLALAFSMLVELGQFFIVERHSSIADVSSNVLGALAGWLLWVKLARRRSA